jgi:hypothetical protein
MDKELEAIEIILGVLEDRTPASCSRILDFVCRRIANCGVVQPTNPPAAKLDYVNELQKMRNANEAEAKRAKAFINRSEFAIR